MATLTKRSRSELEALKQQHREIIERLVASYRSVLEHIDPDGPAAAKERAALASARKAVEAAGGLGAQYSDIDKVTAHHGDNHVPLVARHFRNDRAAMLAMVSALRLQATSADTSVLDLLGYVREHAALTRDHIPDHVPLADADGNPVPGENGKPRTRVFDTSLGTQRRGVCPGVSADSKRDRGSYRRPVAACSTSAPPGWGWSALGPALGKESWPSPHAGPLEAKAGCLMRTPGGFRATGVGARGQRYRAEALRSMSPVGHGRFR